MKYKPLSLLKFISVWLIFLIGDVFDAGSKGLVGGVGSSDGRFGFAANCRRGLVFRGTIWDLFGTGKWLGWKVVKYFSSYKFC